MNNQRRKELENALKLIGQAQVIIETANDEEQAGFDNLPEGLQFSEKGEKMEENVSVLEDAISQLEEVINNINTAAE